MNILRISKRCFKQFRFYSFQFKLLLWPPRAQCTAPCKHSLHQPFTSFALRKTMKNTKWQAQIKTLLMRLWSHPWLRLRNAEIKIKRFSRQWLQTSSQRLPNYVLSCWNKCHRNCLVIAARCLHSFISAHAHRDLSRIFEFQSPCFRSSLKCRRFKIWYNGDYSSRATSPPSVASTIIFLHLLRLTSTERRGACRGDDFSFSNHAKMMIYCIF